MPRPSNEIDPSTLPKTVKQTRKTLAYLLRAAKRRISVDSIGERRYRGLSSELTEALVPLVVSERTMLGFWRAFCSRFEVEEHSPEWGPLEVWMPEGRMSWARAISSLDYGHVRTVVQENPSLLADFAMRYPGDEDEEAMDAQMFDTFPDPPEGGRFTPVLPSQLIAPRTFRTVWTLTSPMSHGADDKSGNVNLFRRHRVVDALTGQHHFVPFMSGNAVRGMWRDMLMARWCELIGVKPERLPAQRVHALFAGGSIEAGADGAGVDLDVRRRARELCPPWDLLGGCIDQQIMQGHARVHDAVLVCRENAWMVQDAVAPGTDLRAFAASLPEAAELTQLRLGTRHAHREFEGAEGSQMLFNTELLLGGSQMMHSLQVYGISGVLPTTAACLADLLRSFRDYATVGASNARGYGLIAFEPYAAGPDVPALPDPKVYLDYVAERRDEMRAWILEAAARPAKPEKPAKGARGRVVAKAAPIEADVDGVF